jgi:hypothetical protein
MAFGNGLVFVIVCQPLVAILFIIMFPCEGLSITSTFNKKAFRIIAGAKIESGLYLKLGTQTRCSCLQAIKICFRFWEKYPSSDRQDFPA